MSTVRTISRRFGTRAVIVAIVALSAGLLGACGAETMTDAEAPLVSGGAEANLNPNEHRGHSGQPGTESPNVNQREHSAHLGVSKF